MPCVEDHILNEIPGRAARLTPICVKAGVHVYRCEYEGRPAVVKYFEHAGDRREIENYRLLTNLRVPVMDVYALTKSCIVMEDIAASRIWRLGEESDMSNPSVLRALAQWYFALHEAGEGRPELPSLYSENDELIPSALSFIAERIPGAQLLCDFTRNHLDEFRALLRMRENTLAYNDFYCTNFLVRRDGTAAMMFDYNLMGRGYRYADFRNVESSVSPEAFAAFREKYAALHRAKYGADFVIDETDRRLDDFLSPLLGLVSALKRDQFPAWAADMKEEALNGTLLAKGKEIIKHAQG